jgi:hypothetical protein
MLYYFVSLDKPHTTDYENSMSITVTSTTQLIETKIIQKVLRASKLLNIKQSDVRYSNFYRKINPYYIVSTWTDGNPHVQINYVIWIDFAIEITITDVALFYIKQFTCSQNFLNYLALHPFEFERT